MKKAYIRDYNDRLHEFVLVGADLQWFYTRAGARHTATEHPDVIFDAAVFRDSMRLIGTSREDTNAYLLRSDGRHMGIPHPFHRGTVIWFRNSAWRKLERLLAAHVRKVVIV